MNTIAAATAAQVSATTIRNWCRTGTVAAVKQAGRWVIDSASLYTRIALLKIQRTGRTWIIGKARSGWYVENTLTGAIYTGMVHVGALSLADHLNRRDS